MKRSLRVAFGLAALLSPAIAGATQMLALSIEQLSREATQVVRGTVLRSAGAWGPEGRRIYTYTELEVRGVLAGEAKVGEQLLVRSLGGQVGGMGMRVAGAPRLQAGEDVVLFLEAAPKERGVSRVLGMSQGLYRVVSTPGQDPQLVPGMAGIALVGERGDAGQMSLSQLTARVQAARQPARVSP